MWPMGLFCIGTTTKCMANINLWIKFQAYPHNHPHLHPSFREKDRSNLSVRQRHLY